ncbi:DUF6985 domain-containing protein [Ochrobactrum quorumnocens]|uniref:DUF6985 domain-containing protein n=1 Tax=Ochrobactrum quorumnocens TaxID=271865 RepID=UPI003854C791
MPQTSTLWHSLVALPHPRRGYSSFAEPGEVPVSFENDDGEGDSPDPIMLETARWLIENDEEVERVIIDTILSDMPRLRDIQSGIVLGDEDKPLPESCDEPMLRQMVRLLHLTLPPIKGKLPYFGAELACTWDREHGYGVMFHGTNVVKSGGGDIPNLSWVANRHAEGRT